MITAAPPWRPFGPGELPVALPRRSLNGCAICKADVPLSPRTGRCTVCNERELYDLATRKDIRRFRPRPSLWSLVRFPHLPISGVAWIGGAMAVCAACFAFVPNVAAP